MPEQTIVKTKRDGIITIKDGTSVTPLSYVVAYEPGDFNYTVPGYSAQAFLDRGAFGATPSLRRTDDQAMTLGFSAYVRDLGDTVGSPAYATLPDICERRSGDYVATTWKSTLGASADVFTVTVQLTISGAALGEADKTLSFPFVVLRGAFAEGDPDTYTVSGTSYAIEPSLA